MNNRSNKKLINNIILSSVYQMLVMIVPIITTPYVTRIFDAGKIGEYNLSLSIVSMFVVASQFGLPSYGSREISIAKNDIIRQKVFFELFTIQLFLSLFLFLIFNFIFTFLLNLGDSKLFFLQSFFILANILDISWFFIGIEEIGKTIVRNALTKVFTTLSVFLLVKNENQINLYAVINIVGMILGNITMIISSFKYVNYRNMKLTLSKGHLLNSFKLLLPKLISTSHDTAERNVLNFTATPESIGIYSEGKKIINLAFSVINSAFNALSPRMSYHVSLGEYDKVKVYFNKGLENAGLFSVIIVSGIISVSSEFVDFFYGDGYIGVGIILRILALSLIIIPIISLLNSGILIPRKKDKEYLIGIIIIFISGIILNIFLDPVLGAIGAAISYSISQLLSLIYLGYICRDIIEPKQIFKSVGVILILIILNISLLRIFTSNLFVSNSMVLFLIKGVISVSISIILIGIVKIGERAIKYG